MNKELKKLEELLANDRKIIEENYKEIERLNNIINEFEKLLKEEKTRTRYANDVERFTAYDFALKKLQELKGADKE